jgi:hypothetical protein
MFISLPYSDFQNANQLLERQQLAKRHHHSGTNKMRCPQNPQQQTLSDDFSKWVVSDCYQLLYMELVASTWAKDCTGSLVSEAKQLLDDSQL